MQVHSGIVENRIDPLKLGRCQVRIIGLHTHDKTQLPTNDLPWAYPMQSITSAAMSGIGQSPVGVVEGTTVLCIFMDEPDNQQPVIIGSLGGIPQAKAVELFGRDDDSVILKDPDDNPVPAPVNESEAAAVDPTITPAAAPTTVTTDIPTTPPPGTPNAAAATAGIKAILVACDKFGLTTREQKCSLLAIAGGESLWVPKEEGYSYSADALQSTFKTTFGGKPDLAAKYARWKGTRAEFFDFVYAPENNGRQLGNTQTGDGGKYYGRGFNGVTGRANYQKYGQLAGVDIINNPLLLTTNLTTAAEVFCQMVINNPIVKKAVPTDNPGYFYAVKKGNGKDTGNGAETRLKYYEYFYGNKVPSSFTEEKSVGAAPPAATSTSSGAPSETSAGSIGFQDPNNKYPLKNFINEPDTNRLARGVSKGTVVTIKEANRARSIPIALDGGTYDEPASAFSAKYPYNHVLETESGHVQEWDDTPGFERTHTYHRKGTFTEVDANGSEVTHIVGDSYQIIDNNGCIFISGECNLTTEGKINILCQSDANIEVAQDVTMQVGGDFKLGIAKDFTVAVGGTVSMQAGSDMLLQSNASMHLTAVSEMHQYAASSMHLKASGSFNVDGSTANINGQTAIGSTTLNLTAPAVGSPKNNVLPYLVPPVAAGEEVFQLESEDDWNTPAGQKAKAALEAKYGVQTPDNTPAQDEATPTGGTAANTIASCQVIYATQSFTNDFKLSANFTLGMLIDGGVNGHNALKDQCGLTKQQLVCNLSQLCANILEPALALLPGGIGGYGKQWKINSGFRSVTNGANAPTSDHPYGRATDITLLPYDATKKQRNFELIQKLEAALPYDQMIMEYRSDGSNWIHIGYRGLKAGDTAGQGSVNRKMAFTMLNDSVYKRDSSGNPKGFILL